MRKITHKNPSENFNKMIGKTKESRRSSLILGDKIAEHYLIDVAKLLPFKKQARKHFDDQNLHELADTIKQYGVRQPLTVTQSEKQGYYEVISGERRLRASKLIGMEKVPCIILSTQDNAEEIALIENLQRVDLHPVELGDAYASLMHLSNNSLSDIARKIGVTKSSISEQVSFSKLPSNIKDYLINNNIRLRSLLRFLLKCKTEQEMKNALGIGSKPLITGRRKHILDIYLQDDELKFTKINRQLTNNNKSKLIEFLKNVLSELEI